MSAVEEAVKPPVEAEEKAADATEQPAPQQEREDLSALPIDESLLIRVGGAGSTHRWSCARLMQRVQTRACVAARRSTCLPRTSTAAWAMMWGAHGGAAVMPQGGSAGCACMPARSPSGSRNPHPPLERLMHGCRQPCMRRGSMAAMRHQNMLPCCSVHRDQGPHAHPGAPVYPPSAASITRPPHPSCNRPTDQGQGEAPDAPR